MFKGLGQMKQLAGLLGNLPRIKEQMEQLQARLGALTAEGEAGAGMVRVKFNGRMEMLSCAIAPEAQGDRELLEDLIRAATNVAIERVKAAAAQETQKMSAELGLPMGGVDVPGLE